MASSVVEQGSNEWNHLKAIMAEVHGGRAVKTDRAKWAGPKAQKKRRVWA